MIAKDTRKSFIGIEMSQSDLFRRFPPIGYVCQHHRKPATQSLDEMEFEKGIWGHSLYGDLDELKACIDNGKYTVDQRDCAGYTALHYAARNNHLDICEYLVKKGADVNAVTRAGKASALHRAASTGRKEIVLSLLHKGANPDLEDADGKTALRRALDNNHMDIADILELFQPSPL
ncbi:hypothetical protein HUJ04_002564 [Dendroctonus ponderosae]|nr:hypothetical protein HUJ04_002564 [Dendroctonus ponderosae]